MKTPKFYVRIKSGFFMAGLKKMKEFRVMVDGKIIGDVIHAETIHDAQVIALNKFGNTPNVIAMTQKSAEKYLPTSIIPTADEPFEYTS